MWLKRFLWCSLFAFVAMHAYTLYIFAGMFGTEHPRFIERAAKAAIQTPIQGGLFLLIWWAVSRLTGARSLKPKADDRTQSIP